MANKRLVGEVHETKAVSLLQKQGYYILERNYRCIMGEIDIIAKEGGYLVFVEVKYRHTNHCGYAAEAVNYHKQKKICQTAEFYLSGKERMNIPCRFDVVAIDGDDIKVIKNAFDAI